MEPSAERGCEAGVLVTAHCILNRATRWWQNGKPKEEDRGPVSEILQLLSALKIDMVQLPCPEFTFCGNPRPPRTKDEYNNLPGFRLHCERLAKASALNLKDMATTGRKPGIKIPAVVGVEKSPTCGVGRTPRTVDGKRKYLREKGLFFEILEKELTSLGVDTPFVGVYLDRHAESRKRLHDLLQREAGFP